MVRFLSVLVLCMFLNVCYASAYDTLCAGGSKSFQATFRTGVEVEVGPVMTGGLAVRSCRASFRWDGQSLLVADAVADIDLDLFGADLGVGEPIAAFQIKKSATDCCVSYLIYSLSKPPHLIRTLHGGGYFRAADTNFEGQVEIWADDSAAVDGLEGLHTRAMEFPPTMVLRFEDGRLVDATSEFQPYFDDVIAELRKKIRPGEIKEFKQTAMGNGHVRTEKDALRERQIETTILEIVWAYLYSGRENTAWRQLHEMWPAENVSQVAAEIAEARARGLRAQLDGISHSGPAPAGEEATIHTYTQRPARPIMARYYSTGDSGALRRRVRVDLVVDCAGKVWSAEVSDKNRAVRESVTRATTNWKFIPASVDDQPVASRVRMTISLAR